MSTKEWKPVKGYEGLYEVSNIGEVKSLPHRVKSRFKTRLTPGKELKQQKDKDGYMKVCLCKDSKKKCAFVHRLVVEAFLENPESYPCVNHIDENKTNNNVKNLEFCTVEYNNSYNGGCEKRGKKRRKPVIAKKGDRVLVFDSIKEASKYLGASHGNISSCLYKRYGRKSVCGYTFEFFGKDDAST